MRHHRRFAATLMALGLVLSAASIALAKGEDAVVTLDVPIPVGATPGSTVEIGWTLDIAQDDGSTVPFNAEGVYVRFTPASGASIDVVARQDRVGHYVATVTVPAGGLGDAVFGLRGEACYADGHCERADAFFTVAGSPGQAVADPAAAPGVQPPVAGAPPVTSEAPVSALDLTWLPLLALLGLAAVGVAIAVRGRGRTAAT
jgi:hypothetical protein